MRLIHAVVGIILCGIGISRADDGLVDFCPEPAVLTPKVQKAISRSQTAYTEGLVFYNGFLYESAGQYGLSKLNRIDPSTGQVTKLLQLPGNFFGEGLDFWNGKFLQATWREYQAVQWNGDSSSNGETINFPWLAWGLTHDDQSWILSDGSSQIHFLNPTDFSETSTLDVRWGFTPVEMLNELERVEGELYANVFETSQIVRIDLHTGCVDGAFDLSPLMVNSMSALELQEVAQDPEAVANGIAYDPQEKVFYVTGKNWPRIFRIVL